MIWINKSNILPESTFLSCRQAYMASLINACLLGKGSEWWYFSGHRLRRYTTEFDFFTFPIRSGSCASYRGWPSIMRRPLFMTGCIQYQQCYCVNIPHPINTSVKWRCYFPLLVLIPFPLSFCNLYKFLIRNIQGVFFNKSHS